MHDSDSPEHHRQRSEFVRRLVQCVQPRQFVDERYQNSIPKTIVQFWHDLEQLPRDVEECVASWSSLQASGFRHFVFDKQNANAFIRASLGARYLSAFERCYHPAMQSDYFRLCYLMVEGGFYVDADDICICNEIDSLFDDGRLKLQPLCYDIASAKMIEPSVFIRAAAGSPNWIFYFNNNPLVVGKGHPIIERALGQATAHLEFDWGDVLPEIQMTAGPGNLSKSIFELGTTFGLNVESDLVVLRDWESFALSRWPLSYREDARNWRLSNQKGFDF